MDDNKIHSFCIAEFDFQIVFKGDGENGMHLIPSFEPFRVIPQNDTSPLFQLVVDDALEPRAQETTERIDTCDTGNGEIIVSRIKDGGYQFIIHDLMGKACCLLITNQNLQTCTCALSGNYNMRAFGLGNALMLVFSMATAREKTILLHASLVRQNGYGYAFIATSGTGKSTQVSMWLRHLPGCDLMNDDNPIVRIINNHAYIYGSPWSGKTPCYRNIKAPLGAITQIMRDQTNYVEKSTPMQAFANLLPACSTLKWDEENLNNICDSITALIQTVGIYTLHCLPNKEAAEVCNKTISVSQRN